MTFGATAIDSGADAVQTESTALLQPHFKAIYEAIKDAGSSGQLSLQRQLVQDVQRFLGSCRLPDEPEPEPDLTVENEESHVQETQQRQRLGVDVRTQANLVTDQEPAPYSRPVAELDPSTTATEYVPRSLRSSFYSHVQAHKSRNPSSDCTVTTGDEPTSPKRRRAPTSVSQGSTRAAEITKRKGNESLSASRATKRARLDTVKPSKERPNTLPDTRPASSSGSDKTGASLSSNLHRKTSRKSFAVIKQMTSPKQFLPFTHNMSDEYTIERVAQLRQRYHHLLLQMTKDQTSEQPLFDQPKHAAQLANFFFGETIGLEGLKRVSVFVQGYTGTSEEPDVAAAGRIMQLANDKDIPHNMRFLFAAFGSDLTRAHPRGTKRTGSDSINEIVDHVRDVRSGRTLLKRFKQVSKDIKEKEPATTTFIARQNLTTAQGRGIKTIAISLLSRIGQIDSSVLKSKCDRARGIDLVCQKLGEAFVLLTPPTSMPFLQKIGIKRLGPACDLLLHMYPLIAPAVKLLQESIWEPYLQGQPKLACHMAAPQIEDQNVTFLNLLRNLTNLDVPEPKYVHPPDDIPQDRIQEVDSDEDDSSDSICAASHRDPDENLDDGNDFHDDHHDCSS